MKLCTYKTLFPKAVAAQGQGKALLVLHFMDVPVKAGYSDEVWDMDLEHRWLTETCARNDDDAPRHDLGGESRYLSSKDYPQLYADALRGSVNLFDYLHLL